jgi:hypothetical protein
LEGKTMRRFLLGSLTLLALVFPTLAAAQPTPLTPVITVHGVRSQQQVFPSVAAESDGDFVVTWASSTPQGSILFRRYDAAGAPTTQVLQANQTPVTFSRSGPEVAIHAATGNFLIVWESFGELLTGRVFDRAGNPLTGEIEIFHGAETSSDGIFPSLAATPSGFVAAWSSLRGALGERAILARRLDPAGAPLGPEIQVAEEVGFNTPAVAADAEGRFAVVWIGQTERRGVWGRIFEADGDPRGGELRLDGGSLLPLAAAVEFGPDGGFLVAWTDNLRDVLARGFEGDGVPRGPVARLSTGGFPTGEDPAPAIAPDGHGGFAVFWSAFDLSSSTLSILGRIVQGSGSPRGPEFILFGIAGTFAPSFPAAAAGPPGQLVLAWNALFESGSRAVYSQRFAVPPATGADPCVVRGNRLVCDTLRDESGATLEVPLEDPQAGDLTLLGDFNGDRRDDVCVYRQGSFRCDLDHNGVPEAGVAFGGLRGDVPLLGDVNGDGREDACLRRGRRFSCDTARNGGTGEVQIILGLKTDLALMGDIDGDGDDDPCLFRRDRFLCDTAHDGNRAEVTVVFGLPGDVPLLGDADGDGDEDPCVFRGDRFLCDTAHDGGTAEVEILFGEPGAIPLLGNVDGF